MAEQFLEPFAESLGLDLTGVGAAHRRDHVGVEHPGLQEVHHAVREVFLEEQRGMTGQTEIAHHLGRKEPLVGDVVDRQHRLGVLEEAVPAVEGLEIDRHQRRVPVVAMHDVGAEAHSLAALENGAREESEAQVLVPFAGVEAVALVELGTVDEIDAETVHPFRTVLPLGPDQVAGERDGHLAC